MTSNTPETDDNDCQAQYDNEEDDEQSELENLQADANMPLDELLKLYSKNVPISNNDTSQDVVDDDDDDDYESISSSEIDDHDRRHSFLHANGELLSDDDDTEDSLYEPEIIKVINIGDEHQAQVELKAEYDVSDGNCDDREVPADELLWSSFSASDTDNENIDGYLKTIRTEYPSSDDEISLQTLLNCDLNTELALVKFQQLPVKTIYSYPSWPLSEIEQLEEGLREYGKNFYKISVYKCMDRSVREIVHFYYQWKKSERYQLFIKEQQRINSLNSVSDIIEKLIEEREQQLCTAAGVIDSTNTSSFLSNDFKLHAPLSSNSSYSIVTIHQQETTTTTTKRSFDQVDNDNEPSSKKTSHNTKKSSTETTATIV